MRRQYYFSKAKRNPYAKRLKKRVTIRLDEETLRYFRPLSVETGIAYQTLINLYFRQCAATGKSFRFIGSRPPEGLPVRPVTQPCS